MQKKNKEIIESLKINSKDVGSSEVQIGLLSEKINYLSNHFKKNKNDKHSTRGLLFAVNRRKRLLEYLKNNNPESYKKILSAPKVNDMRKKSLFMIAYIYNNNLEMYTHSKDYYDQFKIDYNNDDLIPSVEYELEQIKAVINKK